MKRLEISTSLIEDPTVNCLFSMTRKDINLLDQEIRHLEESSTEREEVFFKFENYPIMICIPSRVRAKWFVNAAEKFYSQFPDGKKYWVSVKEVNI